MTELEIINKSVEIIRSKTDIIPEVGLILGSGLGDYADQIENPVIIPYSELPEFPVSTVFGHAGQFVIGEHKGKKVIAMQGRVHYYEGYTQRQITLPTRIMKKLGIQKLILTNAAGGVNRSFKPGTLMLISDHINYSGQNPLIGSNMDEFGPRFPDMSNVYTKALRARIKEIAKEENIELEEGVYMMFTGPSFETPAEIRMAAVVGADAVGMSTVPEAIVAAHSGIEVVGISCVTNLAAGILDQKLTHEEVMEVATMVKSKFVRLIDAILEKAI